MEEYLIESCLRYFEEMQKHKQQIINEGAHDYSLLNALLKANDEVRLHSRFIYSMLNPQGSHYCGNIFLKTFFQQLPDTLKDFIDVEQAKVFREKDNIDLLIHDNHNFMIIENKLNAIDQKYQITRYIQYIKNKFFADGKGIAGHVVVVYLSKSRKAPAPESESMIGFELKDSQIHWQKLPRTIEKLQGFELPPNTFFPFVHFSYFPMLKTWVDDCSQQASADGIKNAFEEYRLILNRLHPTKQWRNVLSLDQYVLNKLNEDQQKQMYMLMVESRKRLADFVAHKIFQAIINTFGEEIVNHHEAFRPLSANSIKRWLTGESRSRDNWKDVGFYFLTSSGQRAGLLFAIQSVYFGPVEEEKTFLLETNKMSGKHKIKELLLDNPQGLFMFLDEFKERSTAFGFTKTPTLELFPNEQ